MKMKRSKPIRYFSIALLWILSPIYAKDLGQIGHGYPIAETDFIEMAQTLIQNKMNRGEWRLGEAGDLRAIKNSADRPAAVPDLKPTQKPRQWLFDPSFVAPQNVTDAQGKLLFTAGSRVNPLTQWHWTKTLIFFDGDDPNQVEWLEKYNQKIKAQSLLILVQGSIHQTSLHFPHQKIYFDQGGKLVRRLGITQIPATVSSTSTALQITEVKI